MPQMPDLPDISSFAGPIYILFIVIEIVLITIGRARGLYETRDASTSVLMGLGNVISGIVFAGTVYAGMYALLFWFYQFAPVKWEFSLWAVLACLVLDDFKYYWSHRIQHRMRWGWANHVVHHSSQHYNLTTALRQPWFSFAAGTFVLAIPLVLLGFHPGMLAFVGSINLFYQFFIHTETVGKLPAPIEAVFNTPSHHRVHHGRNPRYLDSNYAGIFIIWDKMFGTFVPEQEDDPVEYGIIHNLGTFNPLRVAVHEYVSIFKDLARPGLSLWQRFCYAFAPPGWSHDGSRKGSEQIKADYLAKHPELRHTPGLKTAPKMQQPRVKVS
jgi:sterol desaturase/sphingolipid hydroxylase (fatty acid hydroxylase superfamily)